MGFFSSPPPAPPAPEAAALPFLEGFIAFSIIVWAFEFYLDVRQRRQLGIKEVPGRLQGVISAAEFEAARQYSIDKLSFKMLEDSVGTFKTIAFYLMGGLPLLWSLSMSTAGAAGVDNGKEGEMWHSIVFGMIFYTKESLESLPWEMYREFVLEERHGFNKQSVSLFLADQVKTFFLVMLMGMPVLAGLIWVIKAGGDNFYIYAWALSCALIFFFLTVYPNVIAPLFNKFSALEEGKLKTAIEQLAKENKFPLTKLYVVDGSTRSSHSNAYFYGFGSQKRIVLYDTLSKKLLSPSKATPADETNGCSLEEIVAILAHELGHWKLWHTFFNLAIVQLHLFFFFFFLGGMINSDAMYSSFGFKGERAVVMGLILFSNIISPIDHIIQFLIHLLSRRFEYQADEYAVKQGKGKDLMAGLIKISKDNKSNANPEPLYSAYHHTHPALIERLDAISKSIKAKAD